MLDKSEAQHADQLAQLTNFVTTSVPGASFTTEDGAEGQVTTCPFTYLHTCIYMWIRDVVVLVYTIYTGTLLCLALLLLALGPTSFITSGRTFVLCRRTLFWLSIVFSNVQRPSTQSL